MPVDTQCIYKKGRESHDRIDPKIMGVVKMNPKKEWWI
jgi:hypothetical protein